MYLSQSPRPPRQAPPGYAWEWSPDSGMSGLGKFKLKKLVKKVGKIVKKVAPIAAAFIPGVGPIAAGAVTALTAKRAGAAPAEPAPYYMAPVQAAAEAGQAALLTAGPVPRPVYRPATYAPSEPAYDEYEPAPAGRAAAGLPAWAIPAGIAALAALLLFSRKR